MADTLFTDGVTLTAAEWMNDLNRLHYTILGDPANAAAVFAAIKQAASDTATGAIELAIQSEQETGTDVARAVTPGRQHFHPSAAKAWINFSGDGATVHSSYNVSSLTDNGVGSWTINFNTDFSSTAYVPVTTSIRSGAQIPLMPTSLAAGSCSVEGMPTDFSGTQDTAWNYAAFFGDH